MTTVEKVPFLRKITGYSNDARAEAGVIRFVLGDERGTTVTLDVTRLSDDIKERAMIHGLSQKIGDMVAGLSKDKLYTIAQTTLEDGVIQLYNGEWNAGREGNGGQAMQDLIDAIAKIQKADREKVAEVIANATPEKIAEWKKHKLVSAEMKDIAAKRAKAQLKAAGGADQLDFPM